MSKRSSLLAESAERLANLRLTGDVVPVIDLAETIADAIHPHKKSETRRTRAQRLETKQSWDEKIEVAMLTDKLPALDPVTLIRVNPTKAWLGNACVTRADLMSWLKSCGLEAAANRLTAAMDDAVARTDVDVTAVKPVSRRQSQDEEILSTIRSLGLHPTSVPKGRRGTPGVRGKVWSILKSKPGWTREVFRKAWQRFLVSRKVVDPR
jgi:hypothetical protein